MLEKIKSPSDIKKLSQNEIDNLVIEMRREILRECADGGGHLASNLGIVEATVALHRVFDSPKDSIIFDVGHQCYAHKLLTGRYDKFSTLRRFGGISGFTNREESEHDALTAGHSGSALPTALGIARANAQKNNDNWAVAVIGDGSFTNGMVFEALNCCAETNSKLIILLNDNEMSISKNVGAMSGYFSRLRNSRKYFRFKKTFQNVVSHMPGGKKLVLFSYNIKEFFKRLLVPNNVFENLGLYYLGPVNGNDEEKMEALLREAKTKNKCTIIHMLTLKGNGYERAEKHPENYHFTSRFDINEGVKSSSEQSYSSVMGEYLCEIRERNPRICAVTAAMEKGTGLSVYKDKYTDSFYDVGIAEECAVTFAGGLAIGGMLPVCALYSTFMQRTFDQLLEDVSLQNTHVIMAIDRAGLVPGDGVTHQGVFDVAMLSAIPGTVVYSPESYSEMKYSFDQAEKGEGLWALRYPKGAEADYDRSVFKAIDDEKTIFATDSEDAEIAVITYGRITPTVLQAASLSGRKVRVIRLLKVNPIDHKTVLSLCNNAKILVVEEGVKRGGVGEAIAAAAGQADYKNTVSIHAIEDGFVPHGDLENIMDLCGFTAEKIAEKIKDL
ncbi:MAG: 1-deoxy-D-xylulose-5-phosphate synthase [Clostridia bacterium]|nr:1-deoxy-D-xylulose-5-phosphate synthase [Clostridia bacterium]